MSSVKAKLIATVVSDVHMDIKNKSIRLLMHIFSNVLKSSKKLKADAVITVGDTTSRGKRVNWNFVRRCFERVRNSAENIILTVGNHDCWSDGEDEYAAGIGEYYSAVKDITGRQLDKPYFSTVVKGYSFICLGNESDSGCDADISAEQLAWLKAELEKATAQGKPAFVFCHQSLNGRHGLPRTWDREEKDWPPEEGGVGKSSDEITAILKSFKNVFYFSGHSHMGLCGEKTELREHYSTFECEDGLHLINLPSLCCGNHHGEVDGIGVGLMLEVYDDKVVLRPKNFFTGRYVKKVSIKNGKPYYEAELV